MLFKAYTNAGYRLYFSKSCSMVFSQYFNRLLRKDIFKRYRGGPEIPIFIIGGKPDLQPMVLTIRCPGKKMDSTTKVLISKYISCELLYDFLKFYLTMQDDEKFEIMYGLDINHEATMKLLPINKSSLESHNIIHELNTQLRVRIQSNIPQKTIQEDCFGEYEEEKTLNTKTYIMEEERKNETKINNNNNPQQSQSNNQQNNQCNNQYNLGLSEEEQLNLAMAMSLEQENVFSTPKHIEPIAGIFYNESIVQ